MLTQLAIISFTDAIVGFLTLIVSAFLFLNVIELEEDDETPFFNQVLDWIGENSWRSQTLTIKKKRKSPMGWAIGKWYITRISPMVNKDDKNPKKQLKIDLIYFKQPSILTTVLENKDEKKDDKNLVINTFGRLDNWLGGRLGKSSFKIPNTANKAQLDVVDEILNTYNEQSRCTMCIYGPPGKGKTRIASLVASKLNACLIYDYNPVKTGDSWKKYCNEARKSTDEPLVFLIDEVDIYMKRVKQSINNTNKWSSPDVLDKPTWNQWFDFKINMTDNIVLIFTMNTPYPILEEELEDSSFMREGRVDFKVRFGKYEKFNEKDNGTRMVFNEEVNEPKILKVKL